jgi:anhydro-N-acetylmuramic acid kinase
MANGRNGEYYIGVMSGTSLDGIDVALVKISTRQSQLVYSYSHPMPSEIKKKIIAVCSGQATNLKVIGELDHQLGTLFSDAILALLHSPECLINSGQVRAIGSHGQTVFHHPIGDFPFTMQLGDANIIATRTGIDTIADFRRKDMAYGGQGAPLVPAFHRTLFNNTHSTIVVLNIGGIANLSIILPDGSVLGYDTGPGNVLIDGWCFTHSGEAFDNGAQYAEQGILHDNLLNQMQTDNYFAMTPPKSTGREYFNLDWVNNQLKKYNNQRHPNEDQYTWQDIQRTLTELTSNSICDQVKRHQIGDNPSLLVCGGGAQNPLIMQQLKKKLPQWQVSTTTERGIDSDFMEAMAFAWLAKQRIHNQPSNLPQVTGASREVSLGVIYPADSEVK